MSKVFRQRLSGVSITSAGTGLVRFILLHSPDMMWPKMARRELGMLLVCRRNLLYRNFVIVLRQLSLLLPVHCPLNHMPHNPLSCCASSVPPLLGCGHNSPAVRKEFRIVYVLCVWNSRFSQIICAVCFPIFNFFRPRLSFTLVVHENSCRSIDFSSSPAPAPARLRITSGIANTVREKELFSACVSFFDIILF